MAAGINSGILYLEDFVDSVNTLPSDFGRLLSYIRSLDDKCQDKSAQIQDCMDAFLEEYRRYGQLPPTAEAARANIEGLQVELIHFSEEKVVIAQLAEDMLTYHLEQLNGACSRLVEDIRAAAPLEAAPAGGGALFRDSSRSMSGFPDLLIAGSEGPRDAAPTLRMATMPVVKSQKKAAAMLQRKSPTHAAPPPAVHQPSGHMPRPKMAQSALMLSTSGNLGAPVAMPPAQYGAAPGPGYVTFFAPVLPNLKPSSEAPQAMGRLLTKQDINLNLVGKQAELLWPDDGQWYLIQITNVNLMARTADILYVTGETEQEIKLDDIAVKGEMSIIHHPTGF